jgi:outer membrane protein assembly factor BamB
LKIQSNFCLLIGVVLCGAPSIGCHPIVDTPDMAMLASSLPTQANDEDNEAGQWPGWRGAGLHGVSSQQNLPVEWDHASGVRWKVKVPGVGNSSPVVWNGRILLTSVVRIDDRDELALLCYERLSGKLLWQRELGAPAGRTHRKNGYASATVATDGRRVFASFGSRGLFCYDVDGRRLWHVDLGGFEHEWGVASSPILHGNLVIQTCDGESESFIAAFSKSTGAIVWRMPRDSRRGWSTPALVEVNRNGKLQFELVVNGTGSTNGAPGFVIGYDPQTGAELWKVRGTTDIPCPTAIVGSGLVISSSGSNGPLMAIQPGGRGDVTHSHVVWQLPTGGPYVPTGLIYQDRLFTIADSGMAACHNVADGELLWKKRLRGTFSASLVAGDGNVYATSEQGDVHVLAAGDKFELLATNRLDESCFATPAIAHGEIYMRTAHHLVCIAAVKSADENNGAEPAVVGESASAATPTISPSDVNPATGQNIPPVTPQ